MSRIIIKNIPKGVSEQKLRAHIGEGRCITDCCLKYTKDGVFRNFAFVGFKTEEEAQAVQKKYNNTFINTRRISIEIAKDLGDEFKPRAWSRYAKDSSSYQRQHPAEPRPADAVTASRKEKKKKKKEERDKKVEELFGELTNDPEFHEFLQLHKARDTKSTWGNDAVLPEQQPSKSSKAAIGTKERKSTDSEASSSSVESDSGDEETERKPKQAAKKHVSDLDYLKSKVSAADKALLSDSDSSSSDDESESDDDNSNSNDESSSSGDDTDTNQQIEGSDEENKDQEKEITKYIIKMKGLPVSIKESQIQEFYKPIVPTAIKIPKNAKGSKAFCMATVEFASKAEQEQAMGRNKNFIGPKRVYLHKSEVVERAQQEDKPRAWEDRVVVPERDGEEESIAESGRLYVRNLPYCCTQEDLEQAFGKFGPLTEVHVPIDKRTKQVKGFAFILFMIPEHAVTAYTEMDGKVFQGRMLHILPARASQQQAVDQDGLTFKQKRDLKLKAQAGSSHNWNSLFLGANAVADVMAERYSTSKSQILDASDGQSLGVRMALGETQIVAETRDFLTDNGVLLDSFSQPGGARSKTVLLAKNLPAGTSAEELRGMFEKHGTLARLLLPPSGVTAIVEFIEPTEAKAAFRNLAYTKFKHLPLYLEWAPADVFRAPAPPEEKTQEPMPESEKMEDKDNDQEEDSEPEAEAGATLFVKNLNFDTAEETLRQTFEKCGKLKAVKIAMKKDMKKPGAMLSLGYGFVEYLKKASADKAIRKLQHVKVDDHALEIKISNKGTIDKEAEAARMKRKKAGSAAKPSTKILVRNIPFEAKAKEVQELFATFGELKFCRLPKKLGGTGSHRGFGFVDFLTKNDAKRAFEALCHSTHLYGRRLVLEWASEDESVDLLRHKTAQYFHEESPNKKLKKSELYEELRGNA